ncbi:MAG: DUF4124 domain-containing protein [Burkholderiales bacterium]|nr:DUF4124 domain-containing protein [Burkholderiales bacterium]
MKQLIFVPFLFAILGSYAHAQTDVYVCTDERGNKEYKNTAAGSTKGCKRVELPGITTVPAPKRPVVAQTASKSASTPADFPKADGSAQKARDNDRRQILLDELKNEEQKLSVLQKEFNGGEPERRGDEKNFAKYQERVGLMKEDMSRTEKNIEALKREISNLK